MVINIKQIMIGLTILFVIAYAAVLYDIEQTGWDTMPAYNHNDSFKGVFMMGAPCVIIENQQGQVIDIQWCHANVTQGGRITIHDRCVITFDEHYITYRGAEC